MVDLVLDTWGKVASGGSILAVKVVVAPGGGYLVLTREERGEFDSWVETLEEAEEYLEDFKVEWPQ